jgi:hypothetical protein
VTRRHLLTAETKLAAVLLARSHLDVPDAAGIVLRSLVGLADATGSLDVPVSSARLTKTTGDRRVTRDGMAWLVQNGYLRPLPATRTPGKARRRLWRLTNPPETTHA